MFGVLLLIALAVLFGLKQHQGEPRFLSASLEEFVALFPEPSAPAALQTRHELDDLLSVQQMRTPSDIEAARADRKTEVWQFAEALGTTRERVRDLRSLSELAEQVESDERPYVRAAKHHFLRLRPYEVDMRLKPCIDDVAGDLSYPSGHATYGYLTAYLLADMVPERREQLMARAGEFAWQRAVCGVHFPSDLQAGQKGAEWLAEQISRNEDYRKAADRAARDLRTALGLQAERPATPR
jgi:acid phosphatase (class A)